MSVSRSVGFLAYAFVLYSLFILTVDFTYSIRENAAVTGNPTPTFFFPLYYIPLGLVLGFPVLLWRFRQSGSWKFDWDLFVFVGLPLLYIIFFPALYFAGPTFLTPTSGAFTTTLLSIEVGMISGLFAGCFLVTSFRKLESRRYGLTFGSRS
ncbi:hypothetical protein ACFO4L_01455 [Bacillus daqingensis]|uniref:Uncharacterized protein n=1 Tax=Bacillus daqingensis TaxID=872396 RepID=A0ABV9NPD6_9BACI